MMAMKKFAQLAAVAAGLLAVAPEAFAKGCAMCYASAAAQSPGAARQLDIAILTLLIPSVLLFGGVLFSAFRRRDRGLEEEWCEEAGREGVSVSALPESLRAPR
jgi:hypothetical protein